MNTKRIRISSRPEGSGGFSLVEVMVAMLVLSIGLIGVASLQLTGLHSNQTALIRSQATILASDIIDRMRANPQGVLDDEYDDIKSYVTPPPDPGCINAGCGPQNLARHDTREWVGYFRNIDNDPNFARVLPKYSTGEVRSLAGGVFRVTIEWLEVVEDEDDSDDGKDRLEMNFRL